VLSASPLSPSMGWEWEVPYIVPPSGIESVDSVTEYLVPSALTVPSTNGVYE
jgi:hypothetical protein